MGENQPPSGGCVLKQIYQGDTAVFDFQPPSGGCVLKRSMQSSPRHARRSAAFGRLCVETNASFVATTIRGFSRLRAAVC